MGRLSGNMRNRIAGPLVALSLLFAVFAIGSAHRWAIVVGAGLSMASTLPYWGSKRQFSSWPPLLVFLGVCTVLTALQLLPLPAGLVAILSPGKYALISDNGKAMQESAASFYSISLDPPATMRELGKLIGYLAFAFTCLRLRAKKGPVLKLQIASVVVAIGSLVALTALVHRGLSMDALFGIYEPEYIKAPTFVSPLLNSNHLAGLMALCAPTALGLATYSRGKKRALFIAALLLCSAVCVLSQSRGGVLALAFGLLLAASLLFIGRNRKSTESEKNAPKKIPIPQMVVGLCVFVVLGLATGNGVLQELSGTSTDEITGQSGKVDLWRSSKPLIAQYPILGIGRGAFEQAVSRVRPSAKFSYASLENEYLQAIVDWGLVGALMAALAFLFLVVRVLPKWRVSAIEAGALAGIAALSAQNLVDFGLSLPGLALPAIALTTVVSGASLSVRRSKDLKPKYLHAGAVALGTFLVLFLASPANRAARDERCADTCSLDDARVIWRRHPADYASAGRTAIALYAKRDKRAIPVLNQALNANPRQWGLHLLAARWLHGSTAKDQAAIEYASAVRDAPAGQIGGLVEEIAAISESPEKAAVALPRDGLRIGLIARVLNGQGHGKIRLAYAHLVMDSANDDRKALKVVSSIALQNRDFALAKRSSRRIQQLWPSYESLLGLAKVELASGNSAGCQKIVDDALADSRLSGVEQMQFLQLSSQILIAQKRFEEARLPLEKALKIPSAGKAVKASIHRSLAEVEDGLGNRNQAALERRIADELSATAR